MPRYEITHGPTFSLLKLDIGPDEVLVAEAGTMVARSSDLDMDVKLNAGRNPGLFGKLKTLFIALLRKFIGGETFFVNHFHGVGGGWVWLAPTMSGAIRHIQLAEGESMIFSAGAYLASAGGIDLKIRFGGLRALFAKEGAFFIETVGPGDIWITSYGAIDEVQCSGSYVVDTGHIVGFDSSLNFKIRSPGGGALGFLASGEGLVCEFEGNGRILIQSRNVGALVQWLTRMLPY
jgi:uncharacterized protein (TIGR00266 family)